MKGVSRKDSNGRVLRTGEQQRKNGSYVFQYTNNRLERKTVSAPDLQTLRKKEEQIKRDLSDNINPDVDKITLNEVCERALKMKKGNVRWQTYDHYQGIYRSHIKNDFGQRKISKIKSSDIQEFYESLKENGKGKDLIHKVNLIINWGFELAVNDDYLRKNPARNVLKNIRFKKTEPKRTLTREEQKEFMRTLKNHSIWSDYYGVFVVLFGTGCRMCEVAGLTWNDIDFENNVININHSVIYRQDENRKTVYMISEPKTKKGYRTIPMLHSVREVLEEEKEKQKNHENTFSVDGYTNFVFLRPNKMGFYSNSFRNVIRRVVDDYNESIGDDKKKLPYFSVHQTRHTFASRMYEANVQDKVIQEILGHSNISVTLDIYTDIASRQKEDAMVKIDLDKILNEEENVDR